MPVKGEIKTKGTYIGTLKELREIKQSFYNVFAKDVSILGNLMSTILGMHPVLGGIQSGIAVTSTLSNAQRINYAKAAYETLDSAYSAIAEGRAHDVVMFQDFVWIYEGKNKQYWRLTGKLSVILG